MISPLITNSKDYFTRLTSKEFSGHKKKVYSVAWNFNGSKLASGSADSNIRIWSFDTTNNLEKGIDLKSHLDSVHQVIWSPTEENILSKNFIYQVSSSSDKTLKFWDIRTSKNYRSDKIKGGCFNLSWSSDNNYLAYTNKNDDVLSILDIRKGIVKQCEFKNQVNEFHFDKNMNCFIVCMSTGNINFYCAKTFNFSAPLVSLEAHFAPVHSLTIEPKNQIFATAGADALICLWDLNELISYKVLRKGESSIRKIIFSYDSKFIASISEESCVDIYDVDASECVHSIICKSIQNSIAWNPKSLLLAYCGEEKNRNNADDGSIHIFGI